MTELSPAFCMNSFLLVTNLFQTDDFAMRLFILHASHLGKGLIEHKKGLPLVSLFALLLGLEPRTL